MKSFRDILAETKREYGFRIKIVGTVEDGQVSQIERALQRWNLINFTKPKVTPIQKHPQDFPGVSESEVSIIDVVVEYPTTPEEVRVTLSQLADVPASNIKVFTDGDQTEIDREEKDAEIGKKKKGEALLTSPYKKSKEKPTFGDKYNQAMLKKQKRKQEFKVAGGNTPKAATLNDIQQGNTSPVGSIKNAANVRPGK